jgi:hypothetical protein
VDDPVVLLARHQALEADPLMRQFRAAFAVREAAREGADRPHREDPHTAVKSAPPGRRRSGATAWVHSVSGAVR